MKKLILFSLLSLALLPYSFAQSVGDFRSVSAGGNWNATGTLQTWNGSSWVAAGSLPTSSTSVYIKQVDNITVTIPSGYNASCASLIIGDQAGDKNDNLIISGTGTLTVNGNLDFHRPNAGATNDLNIGAGTVTISGNLTFVGVATNSNRFAKITVTTGTLTIGGDLVLNAPDNATASSNEIDLSGGAATLNLAGSYIIPNTGGGGKLVPGTTSTFNYNGSSVAQTIQTGFSNFNYNNLYVNNTHASGATLSAAIGAGKLSGDLRIQTGILNNGGFGISVATNKTFETVDGAIFKMTSASIMPAGYGLNPTITTTLGTNSTVEYSGSNQTVKAASYGHLKIRGSGSKTMEGNISVAGDLTIDPGTTLDVTTSNYNITLTKNWVNNGTFNAQNGSVTFNGNSLQSIGGSTSTTFKNLTINNSQDVALANNQVVSSTLTISSGKLIIAPGYVMNITSGNAVSGSSFNSNKMIETQVNTSTGAKGYLRIGNITGSMTFPVGTSANYMPATVTPISTSDFSVNVFPGATANGMPNGTAFTTTAKKKIVDAIWNVERNSGTGATTLQVAWPASLKGTTFSGLANGSIGLSHFDGTYWDPAFGNGSQTNNTATRTGITSFSPFGAGETNTPLPLRFDVIKVYQKNNGNQVDWSSLTEVNVSHYEIERSTDGQRFSTVSQKPAIGNNSDKASYGWLDMSVPGGVVYYRIKAVDLDGKLNYSSIVRTNKYTESQDLLLFPNPVKDKVVSFELSNIEKGNYDILVIDRNGSQVQNTSFNHYGGSISHTFSLPAGISSGIYNLRISGNGKNFMKTFIVK